MSNKYHHECPFTEEEAFNRFSEISGLYGHLGPVSLYYFNGGYDLTYTTYETADEQREQQP